MKIITMKEAIERHVHDGDTIATDEELRIIREEIDPKGVHTE
jgi:hypothetical protein